jgi:hypothetical protein
MKKDGLTQADFAKKCGLRQKFLWIILLFAGIAELNLLALYVLIFFGPMRLLPILTHLMKGYRDYIETVRADDPSFLEKNKKNPIKSILLSLFIVFLHISISLIYIVLTKSFKINPLH